MFFFVRALACWIVKNSSEISSATLPNLNDAKTKAYEIALRTFNYRLQAGHILFAATKFKPSAEQSYTKEQTRHKPGRLLTLWWLARLYVCSYINWTIPVPRPWKYWSAKRVLLLYMMNSMLHVSTDVSPVSSNKSLFGTTMMNFDLPQVGRRKLLPMYRE